MEKKENATYFVVGIEAGPFDGGEVCGVLQNTYTPGSPQNVRYDFTFDAAGNLQTLALADGTVLSVTYDPSGRTKTVNIGGTAPNSDGTVVTYRYGPDERLTERTVDLLGDSTIDSVTRYFSDGLISWEIDGLTGNLLRAYVFLPDGFTPFFIVAFAPPPPTPPEDPPAPQPGTIYFVHNDHLSTPKAVTDLTGTPVWLARHQSFGQVVELCGGANGTPAPNAPPGPCTFSQPLRFPGQWDQSDAHPALAGVWYNWHRFYLPQWGMYARRDPIVRADGREFSYVGGQPGSRFDPTGLMPWGGSPDGSYEAGMYDNGSGDIWGIAESISDAFLWPWYVIGIHEKMSKQKWRDKYAHCVTSCLVAQEFGSGVAMEAGWVNEDFMEWIGDWNDILGTGDPHPAETLDICANEKGIRTAERAGNCSLECLNEIKPIRAVEGALDTLIDW